MTLRRSRRVALAAVVLPAALLAGCGGGLSAGPLDGGTEILGSVARRWIGIGCSLPAIWSQRELGRAVQWHQRRSIDSAKISRTYANGGARQLIAFDLVFVVKLIGRTGGFDAVDVYYHNANGHYHLHITNSLGLAAPKDYSRYCGSPPQ